MSKRKLEDLEVDDERDAALSPVFKRQRFQFAALVDEGAKQVFHALRFARGFERQKLGRRQKSASRKGSSEDKERLEQEVAELKKLQLIELAEVYLCKQLTKIKPIAEHEALPRDVLHKAAIEQPRDAAYSNVTSRLYKSDPVTKTMRRIMGDVRNLLGIKEEEARVKKKRMRKADYEAGLAGTIHSNGTEDQDHVLKASNSSRTIVSTTKEPTDNKEDQLLKIDDQSNSGLDLVKTLTDGDESKDGDDRNTGNLDFAEFDARIASESGSEDGSTDRYDLPLHAISGEHDQDNDNLSISDAGSSRESSPQLRRRDTKRNVDISQTTFLPSLNTGYISGSESDVSEASALAPPRKNRMGQRARREMWERKYGDSARHLQGEGHLKKDRDRGWDPIRGAQSNDRGGFRRGGSRGRGFGGRTERNGIGRNDIGARKEVEKQEKIPAKIPTYGKTHPSWAARQAAKEKNSVAAKPAGKKITFD